MSRNILKFYQLNCHKSKFANEFLNHHNTVLKNGIFVGLCQEPGHDQGKIKDFDRSLRIFQGCKINPRACIVIDKSVNSILLNQYSDQDQVAIQITDGNRIIILASIYMPYDSIDPPPTPLTKSLVQFCKGRGWSLIIGSDVNSHNTAWGSTDTNPRGDNLLFFILSANLTVCNQGAVGTFVNAQREEVIDITMATENVENLIKEWRVNTEHAWSDHRLITFSLNMKKACKTKPFRSIRKTNWEKYEETMISKLAPVELEEHPNIDELATTISNKMREAFEESCPLIYAKKANKPVWWTTELTKLKREAAKLALAYRRNNTEENKEAAREAKSEYRREMRKSKNKAWQKYCEEMEGKNATAKLQNIMKKGKMNEIGTLRKRDGTYTNTTQETLDELLHTLFPDDFETEPYDITQNQRNKLTEQKINEIVNTTTVTAAMKSFKPYKSPGEDGIHPIMIQKAIKQLEPYLTVLYRESIRKGRPATNWLRIKAVFIPKPGKTDYNSAKSYRPISLSSFL